MFQESTAVNLTTTSPTTTTHGFEDEANAVVNRVLTTISASLSLLGTFVIIATFIAWKDFRSMSRRILVYISIGDFFIAGGNLFGIWQSRDDSTVCKSQSFVTTCASLWSFFWTTFLAIFMYTVVAMKQSKKAETMLKFYHIIGWGVPLAVTGTALGLGKLGNDKDLFSAGWCWIDSKLPSHDKHLWMWVTGKAWEIAAYILSATFYLMLKCHIRKEVYRHQKQFPSPQSKESALKANKRLTLVPVIFVLVRIWGTLRFIIYISADIQSTDKVWEKILLYLHGIGDSSQGFFNFLLFCVFTEKFQTRLRIAAHALLLNCQKQPSRLPSRGKKTDETSHQPTLTNESTNLLGSV
ncbi:hypothetical protein ACROYT_G020687 [Oculina patagonica]